MQADLNLRWAHMSEGRFSDVEGHFVVSLICFVLCSVASHYVRILKARSNKCILSENLFCQADTIYFLDHMVTMITNLISET